MRTSTYVRIVRILAGLLIASALQFDYMWTLADANTITVRPPSVKRHSAKYMPAYVYTWCYANEQLKKKKTSSNPLVIYRNGIHKQNCRARLKV